MQAKWTIQAAVVAALMCLLAPMATHAQKVAKVSSCYTYIMPDNVTLEQARNIALERAKLQAIADEFGTTVTQSNITYMDNTAEQELSFFSLGGTEVNGEWIQTIGTPKFDDGKNEDGLHWVSCCVEGKAREIKRGDVEFVAKTLCNETDQRFASTDFVSGDEMYLYFQSPRSGYLAAFLVDQSSGLAYCLLPYKTDDSGSWRVEHDTPYVFFSQKSDPTREVDEYTMTCDKGLERNDIYVVFSPNRFTKPITLLSEETMLKTLLLDDFQNWLSRLKTKDKEAQSVNIPITIRSKR